MAQQTIGIGSAPNDGTGDPLRTAFDKCNDNFTELYSAAAPGGSSLQVQYNNGGSFAGIAGSSWVVGTSTLTLGKTSFSANIDIPATTGSTIGVITHGGDAFIHSYADATATGKNVFIGGAGNFTCSPAGGAATLASFNIAIGDTPCNTLTTGSYNTAAGNNSLAHITTGSENVAIGASSLAALTTGIRNVSLGSDALKVLTTASYNQAFGWRALFSLTSGTGNSAIGSGALNALQTGSSNIGIGENAGVLYTGYHSVFIGSYAGSNQVSGNYNTIVGRGTGLGVTTGDNNTIVGARVTGLSSNLASNVIIADGAGNRRINVDSSGNVGLGTAKTTPSCALDVDGPVRAKAYTVATLPAAATVGAGAMSFASDANTTLAAGIGTTVAAGGANFVPVHSNGTNWIIG